MKKIYLWGWQSPSQVKSINHLTSLNKIDVLRWFSTNHKDDESLSNILYKPNIFKNSNSNTPIKDDIYHKLLKYFPKFFDMYSRINYSRAQSYQEVLNLFNIYLRYFYADLKDTNPDYIIFSNFPHFGVDYILYLCAQELNIKILITHQLLFSNRFFVLNSLDHYKNLNINNKNSENHLKIENSFNKDLFYMKKIKQKNRNCYVKLFGDIIRLAGNRKKTLTLSGTIQKFQECQTFNSLFPKNILKTIDIEKKYIYFPLQLQPEMTTSTLGGIYSDQLLALEQLSSIIPNDWLIYVKENPKQTPKQRGELFYKRLNSLKKIKYLSTQISTTYLIKHSQFVSVVTGTAGWEAISGGKSVLIFGSAWYNSLPGVFQYNDKIDINDIVSFKIHHDKLEKKVNILLDNAYEGVVDPLYNKIVENYNEDKNVEFLVKFLKKVII